MVIQRALKTVAVAHATHQRIGAWFAALGCIGVGALVWHGPQSLRDEIPQHRWVGAGFTLFGVVFLLALALRGRAGSRAKNLVLALATAAIAAGCGWTAYREGRIVWELHTHGVQKSLTVHSSTPRFCTFGNTRESWWSVQLGDGPRRLMLRSPRRLPTGAMVTVLTHPAHAAWTAASVGADASLAEIADARETRWTIVVCAGVALLAGLASLAFAWSTLTGAKAPDET